MARPLHRFSIVAATVALLVASAVALTLCSRGASGQSQHSTSAGRLVAERFCVACHDIGGAPTEGAVSAGVPGFATIAARPEQTAEAIAGRIVVPHPQMPDIQLTRREIADVSAYILSLRR
jgi:mono/diheme cytochrome c family protein